MHLGKLRKVRRIATGKEAASAVAPGEMTPTDDHEERSQERPWPAGITPPW